MGSDLRVVELKGMFEVEPKRGVRRVGGKDVIFPGAAVTRIVFRVSFKFPGGFFCRLGYHCPPRGDYLKRAFHAWDVSWRRHAPLVWRPRAGLGAGGGWIEAAAVAEGGGGSWCGVLQSVDCGFGFFEWGGFRGPDRGLQGCVGGAAGSGPPSAGFVKALKAVPGAGG